MTFTICRSWKATILQQFTKHFLLIGHYHSAGVPGRNEIYKGEINYLPIIEAIDKSGYNGYFGLEYWPSEAEESSLTQTLQFLKSK